MFYNRVKFLSLQSFSIVNYTKFEGHALFPSLVRFRWNLIVILNICWKFEVNRLKIDGVMKGHWLEKEMKKIKES